MGEQTKERIYRDADNRPVDPEADVNELTEAAARRPLPPWKTADPDAYRPAQVAGDDDLPLDPEDDGERYGI